MKIIIEIVIDKQHDYYHQIQGQMALTKRTKCIIILWTTKGIQHFIIEQDNGWVNKNMPILKTFYLHVFLPHIPSL